MDTEEVTTQVEIFKTHKSGYQVSNFGRIRGITVDFLKFSVSSGYYFVSLPKNDKRGWYSVHRAVYETFYGDIPENMVINHKDGVKTNNMVENLECVTHAFNTQHAYDSGLCFGKPAEDNPMAKLSNDEFYLICQCVMEGCSNDEIGSMFGIHPRYVSLIRHKKRWTSMFPDWYEPSESINNKIPLYVMIDIYRDCLSDMKNFQIADKWKIDRSTVSRIRTKTTWKRFISYYETRIATTNQGIGVLSSEGKSGASN
jgi:hypothetical protein